MTSFELQELLSLSKDLQILDVREASELEICEFDKALHIPMMEIPKFLDEIPKDKPVIVVCHLGVRSAMTVRYLQENGFDNIHDLLGGIDHWAKNIDPLMQQY